MAAGTPSEEDDRFLCGFFHVAIVLERPPLSSGWTLSLQRIVPEEVSVGHSRNLEFREFGQNGADGNARLEGKGFGIGRAEFREGGEDGRKTGLAVTDVGIRRTVGRIRRMIAILSVRYGLRKFTEDVVR